MNKLTKLIKPSLEYYLNLQYLVTLYPDAEEGGYVGEIKDLPGCFTQGETLEEIMKNIHEARELWIETAYEAGDNIPLPSEKDIINDPLAEFIGGV
ncbi:type II toxin-antitoxin system HicB family antitoxin [Cuspidothrix issatschenkoi LEGE 03284]|nr:type II toxin-antitoxin system HicB family antitoxin [Cuspidothrix issatschenkoi LEGE 03284]